jgi:hypothetical protein
MGTGNTNGAILKCPVGQTCTTANRIVAGQASPWSIVADASYVYWSNYLGSSILKCPLAGCPATGPIPVATTNVGSPGRLAQDATFIYFGSGDQILKVAK